MFWKSMTKEALLSASPISLTKRTEPRMLISHDNPRMLSTSLRLGNQPVHMHRRLLGAKPVTSFIQQNLPCRKLCQDLQNPSIPPPHLRTSKFLICIYLIHIQNGTSRICPPLLREPIAWYVQIFLAWHL